MKNDIGIVGGGQLGRMLAQAARKLNLTTTVLDPDPDAPAAQVTDSKIVAAYDDPQAVQRLAESCEVLTYEFENVSADTLTQVVRTTPIYPSVAILKTTQNRVREKEAMLVAGTCPTPFYEVSTKTAVAQAAAQIGLPGVLKTATMGYDGKGQRSVANLTEAEIAFAELGGGQMVYEQKIELEHELSVIVGRGQDGQTCVFPVCENNHRNHILDTTLAPATVSVAIARAAGDAALKIALTLDLTGLLTVELFVDRQGALLINELAPRPHNSGHHTIESCQTSQFEQLARILAGKRLGSVNQRKPAAMVNLLGNIWDPTGLEPDWNKVVQDENTFLHLYGKKTPRRDRKMGHITVLDDDLYKARRRALAFREALGG